MTAPAFAHDGPGTPSSAWDRWLDQHAPAGWDLPARPGRLVVVGAHPDDETLGAGGLVHRAGREGWRIDVVSATAGEGSHPRSPTTPPDRLAVVRRGELTDAVRVLAPTAHVTCLDLPDGQVGAHEERVVAALVDLVGLDGERTLICAPSRHDGHPDHEAVGRAAALAARRTDAQLVEYPVWLWHWGIERALPWERVRMLGLDAATVRAKQQAVRAHRSQVAPLSDQAGDEALLGADLLAHFERAAELLVLSDGTVGIEDDTLDRLHEERRDPWEVDSSWYERRKRAVTLACLPSERYARGLEVGCSTGALAADLAARCDRLLAVDASAAALRHARERLSEVPGVDTALLRVPEDWPVGDFDLVVVSEVGYFLSPRELDGLVERCRAAVGGGGHLLLCHWRHPVVGWVLDGPDVHDRFRRAWLGAGGRVLVEHADPDFQLTVLTGAS